MKETRNSRKEGDGENPHKGGTCDTRKTETDYGGKDDGGGKERERDRIMRTEADEEWRQAGERKIEV